MKKYILLFFLIFVLVCCKQKTKQINEITKVEMATGSCFGPCQFTAISIDSSLQYKYYGGALLPGKKREVLKGYYVGKITTSFWDSLNVELEKLRFKELDTLKENSSDGQPIELIIHYQNKVKRIRTEFGNLPDTIRDVLPWISESYKRVKLQPIKDSIKFETTIQYPYQEVVSKSINDSKKLHVFLNEYKVAGNKINGYAVKSIFTEKAYYLNHGILFGPYDINPTEKHLIIIFDKPLIKNNGAHIYDKDWAVVFPIPQNEVGPPKYDPDWDTYHLGLKNEKEIFTSISVPFSVDSPRLILLNNLKHKAINNVFYLKKK
jgi:hypothetical protein